MTGVGFGYVYLRKIDGPSSVLCEDLMHPFGDGLGDEAEAYFARPAWLRAAAERHGSQDRALDKTVFTVSPDVHLHMSEPLSPIASGEDPGGPSTVVVERVTGARWRHEIDPLTAAVCSLEEIRALFDEMARAQSDHLPEFIVAGTPVLAAAK